VEAATGRIDVEQFQQWAYRLDQATSATSAYLSLEKDAAFVQLAQLVRRELEVAQLGVAGMIAAAIAEINLAREREKALQ
jgi:hypothetical protein